MKRILQIMERLNEVTHIPVSLLDSDGHILRSFPMVPGDFMEALNIRLLLEDFRLQDLGPAHPLVSYITPGFYLGVMQFTPELYGIVGLVSPLPLSRQDVLSLCAPVIAPYYLQQFCDQLLMQPTFNLVQVKDFVSLLAELVQGQAVPPENILFHDLFHVGGENAMALERERFLQREEAEFHIPADFENAICSAVEAGNRDHLERSLSAPVLGRIGRMSTSELRQQKYTMISLATLVSRAAIRGGLTPETAFSLSDVYCQRMDNMTSIPSIQQLSYTMMMDFCERVRQVKSRPQVSPLIQRCIEYISTYLHEPIGLEDLSAHCGLCTRSLSLRFRRELGMGIPEYIHREKIQEAQYLLTHTAYTLSEIASYLNYPSQSYFTEIFKKYAAQTPQQYRNGPKRKPGLI